MIGHRFDVAGRGDCELWGRFGGSKCLATTVNEKVCLISMYSGNEILTPRLRKVILFYVIIIVI